MELEELLLDPFSRLDAYVSSSLLLIEPSPFVSIALNRFEDDDVDEVELACRISCSR